jgi:lipopolysaccharide export system protein LptA
MSVSAVRLTAVMFLLLVLAPSPLRAEDGRSEPAAEPLTISSEVMTVNNKEKKAVFEDNVVIRKGELAISADRVEVFMEGDAPSTRRDPSPEPGFSGTRLDEGVITKLIAKGHVKFQQGTKHAESREAVYEKREDRIVLTGEPVLYEKEYRVTGTKMTFYLKENKSTIEGSRVLFQPGGGAPPEDVHSP